MAVDDGVFPGSARDAADGRLADPSADGDDHHEQSPLNPAGQEADPVGRFRSAFSLTPARPSSSTPTFSEVPDIAVSEVPDAAPPAAWGDTAQARQSGFEPDGPPGDALGLDRPRAALHEPPHDGERVEPLPVPGSLGDALGGTGRSVGLEQELSPSDCPAVSELAEASEAPSSGDAAGAVGGPPDGVTLTAGAGAMAAGTGSETPDGASRGPVPNGLAGISPERFAGGSPVAASGPGVAAVAAAGAGVSLGRVRVRTGVLVAAVAVLSASVGAAAALGVDRMGGGPVADGPRVTVDTSQVVLSPEDASLVAIAADALESVVSVEILQGGSVVSSGSGFFISSDGYVVTNHHVVADALVSDGPGGQPASVKVTLQDLSSKPAKVVGSSVDFDLAVLKVDVAGARAVTWADSSLVAVGEPTLAVGSPLGLSGTVTSGIVSALDRPTTTESDDGLVFISTIQTDAAINPGNSGGPLLDRLGRVIGVNSSIVTLSGGAIGLGFAIPSNAARRVATELIESGAASTPRLGVQVDFSYAGSGARLSEVDSDGPARQAGLRTGDVIVKVDDVTITDPGQLIATVRTFAPGATLSVVFERDGQVQAVDVPLTQFQP